MDDCNIWNFERQMSILGNLNGLIEVIYVKHLPDIEKNETSTESEF